MQRFVYGLIGVVAFCAVASAQQQTLNNPSGTAISTALYEGGDITPTALSGNVNDYNPTNLSQARTLRIDGGAADRTITGLSGGGGGRIITIVNIGTTNSLILANESGSSGASNRFALGANVTLGINSTITLKWDTTTLRWRTTNSPFPLSVAVGGTGLTVGCALNSLLVGQGTGSAFACSSLPQFGTGAILGANGSTTGTLQFVGATSGTVTVQPQAAAGTYNFNLPTSAGSSGQPLLSAGGGASAMTFGTLSIGGGGTGATTAQAATAALKGVYVLGASAVVSSITGTTSETTLSTIAVPANAPGANGVVRVTVQWGYSGGTGSWTPRIKFNGTAYSDPSAFGNTSLSGRTQAQWANRNATNSQVGMGVAQINFAGATSAVTTSAHDTTASQNITLTCQLANSTDTCSMHSYLVELMVP